MAHLSDIIHLFYSMIVDCQLIELIQLLFSFWPFIFLALLLPWRTPDPGWFTRLRHRLLAFLAAWGLWAFFGMLLLTTGVPTLGLIPEPINTLLYLLFGLLAAAVWISPVFTTYIRIHRAMRTARSVDDLRRLSPDNFEELVAAFFRQFGYKVRRTGRSGDHGIDLLIYTKKDGKWVVQCKRWRGSVGEALIRELYGAMHHEQAQRAFLMTTGTLTPSAVSWAKGKPITLYDGEGLVRLLKHLQKVRR